MWGEGETNMVTSEQKARRKSLLIQSLQVSPESKDRILDNTQD